MIRFCLDYDLYLSILFELFFVLFKNTFYFFGILIDLQFICYFMASFFASRYLVLVW